MSHQELIKVPFWVKRWQKSGVLSRNVYSGLQLLSTVHWAEAVKSTHSMLTDNFQKFCDCFYAPIYPPSPIVLGNEGRKALGKMQTCLRAAWTGIILITSGIGLRIGVGLYYQLSLLIKPERELWVTGSWQLKVSRVVFPSISLLSKSWAISDTISGARLPKLSQHLHTGVLEQFVRSLELP